MGHVDHGKTSLLDAIRSTAVAAGERGGITQHIGASEIVKDDKKVVFLDTPGHEAFTAMRARGAKVTDIAVIVVAADDGVMPQTLEAISHARAAKVPIIIALNKIDKPGANADRVKTELTEANVVIEEYGGDVPLVPVSAKTRQGLDDLFDMVNLVADLQELKANPKREAIGTIIEAELDKGRGPVATVVVQTGTLRIGNIVVVGKTYGKVKALENAAGKRIQKAGPSSAALVLGLDEVPEAGDILRVVADEKTARAMVEQTKIAATAQAGTSQKATLEDLFNQFQEGQSKELRIILKSDVSGSLGAITHALGQIISDEVRISVLHEGTGDITDNDILLASASNAIVVGFNTKLDPQARRTAEAEKVDVRLYDIIYKLTDDIEAALKGMLEPEIVEQVEGRAEVRQVFRVGKSTVIAGLVRDGWAHPAHGRGPGLPQWQADRDGQAGLAPTLPRRRPRRRPGVRVRHRPGRVPRSRGGRHHRGVHPAVGEPREPSVGSADEPANGPRRRAPAPGDRRDPGQGGGGSADRVRHRHGRRDDPRPVRTPRCGSA